MHHYDCRSLRQDKKQHRGVVSRDPIVVINNLLPPNFALLNLISLIFPPTTIL